MKGTYKISYRKATGLREMDITALFCDVDNFCKEFIQAWLQSSLPTLELKTRNRAFKMSPSEVMSLVIWFHKSNARNFKRFYIEDVPEK